MMSFFKRQLKNIILAIVFTAVIIAIGASAVTTVSELELKRSTYTRTTFDFHVSAPDKAQVDSLLADGSAETVFPYYAYKKAFSDDDITLLVSDKMDALDASVLSSGTLVEGAPDADGAMIDVTAATSLGISLGDTVSFTLLGRRFTRTVSAIYLPSTLAIMEEGVVAVAASDDIAAVSSPSAYGGAFVVSRDKDATAEYLSDYVGEGNVALTYDQYVNLYCGTKMPGETDEEYNAACSEKYEKYRQDVLSSAKKSGGQVVDKLEAYAQLKEQILTKEKRLNTLTLLSMLSAFAVFAVVSIIFTVSGSANDKIRRDNGVSFGAMLGGYSASTAVTAAAIAVISLSVLIFIASQTYFLSDCIPLILKLSIATVAAIPIAVLGAFIYTKRLYKSSVS